VSAPVEREPGPVRPLAVRICEFADPCSRFLLIARQDEETCSLGAHSLVLGGRDLERLGAARVAALADEQVVPRLDEQTSQRALFSLTSLNTDWRRAACSTRLATPIASPAGGDVSS
jgi:hypothetical protein